MISPRSCVIVAKIHRALPSFADHRLHPSVCDTVEKIAFERVDWFFPHCGATGITNFEQRSKIKAFDGYDQPWGVIIPGYRCPECEKVFFASEFHLFSHECQEAA